MIDDKEVKVSLTFNFDEEEEEDFKLRGKIVRSNEGKVAIDW